MKGPRAFKNLFLKFLSLPVSDLPPSACVYRGIDSFKRGQRAGFKFRSHPLGSFPQFLVLDRHSFLPLPPLRPFPPFFLVTPWCLGLMLSRPCFMDLSPLLDCFCLVPISLASLPSDFCKSFCSHSLVPFFSASHMWDCLGSGDKHRD